jgi:hypothetical protein
MLLAARQPPKVISEMLGHSTVSFTMDVYTEVATELADAAATAFIPSRARTVPKRAEMITDMQPATTGIRVVAREGRRLGDLNPGWDRSQTALAVRRHRPD